MSHLVTQAQQDSMEKKDTAGLNGRNV